MGSLLALGPPQHVTYFHQVVEPEVVADGLLLFASECQGVYHWAYRPKDGKPSASKSDGLRAAMTVRLQSEDGKACYAKRKQTVEPVFGHIKDGRGARRLMRRGLRACEAEWKLLCGTHNLLKLWRHTVIRPAVTSATA